MVLLVRAWERGDHSKFYDAHEIFVAEGVRGRGGGQRAKMGEIRNLT